MGEGGGENSRPVFRDELTGYDYEAKLTFPTRRNLLEELRPALEAWMYGSPNATVAKVTIENTSTKENRPIKAILSEKLVTSLTELYRFVL